MTSDMCLACHGPIDKLRQTTANYLYSDGSKVNPHVSAEITASKPHASGKGIIECTKCHTPHPQPLTSVKDVQPAELNYCFGCHHQGVFTPCSECHEGYK